MVKGVMRQGHKQVVIMGEWMQQLWLHGNWGLASVSIFQGLIDNCLKNQSVFCFLGARGGEGDALHGVGETYLGT